jgi:secreted Zn-dependent insulinase-like peptidase
LTTRRYPKSLSRLRSEAILELTAHILSEPAFDQLRTHEQLGYIVHVAVKKVTVVDMTA